MIRPIFQGVVVKKHHKFGRSSVFILTALFFIPLAYADTALSKPEINSPVIIVESPASPAGGPSAADPIVTARDFAATNAKALLIDDADTALAFKNVSVDSMGSSHVRFNQMVKNVPVWGGELIVHTNSQGAVTAANGKISTTKDLNLSPSLSASQAVKYAIADWKKNVEASEPNVKSEATLTVYDSQLLDPYGAQIRALAWYAILVSKNSMHAWTYLIDANTGATLFKVSRVKHLYREVYDCSPGHQSGFGDGFCRLDLFVPQANYTFGRSEGQPARGPNPIHPGTRDTDLSYDGVGASHIYFLNKFGRNGANGLGGYGHTSTGLQFFSRVGTYAADGFNNTIFALSICPNANWVPDLDRLSFCQEMPIVDIVGHEYTHAVEHFSLFDPNGQPFGFVGQNEPGALSEGFSDVFGEAIERFVLGDNDGQLGSAAGIVTPIIRNLVNPESQNLPGNKYSANYFCGEDDGGGIHVNNVLLGHLAMLLAKGGSENGCTITSIGADKQEAIFYRALTAYLTMQSGYAEAAQALILSCNDIFGPGSNECGQVQRGIHATLMDQPGRCSGIPQVANECDACPGFAKTQPGACGCDLPDVDGNGNGTLDCQDAALLNGLKPKKAKVTGGTRSLSFVLSPLANVTYRVQVQYTTKVKGRSRKRTITKTFATNKGKIKKLPSGASVSFSYSYVLQGAVAATSKASAKNIVRIR